MKLILNRNIKIFSKLNVIIVGLLLIGLSTFAYAHKINHKYNSNEILEIRVDKLNSENRFDVIKTFIVADDKVIKDFINAMNSKNRLFSKIDIRSPDYSLKIVMKNGSVDDYNLWVGENTKGIIMNDENVWELSIDSTARLKKILESKE